MDAPWIQVERVSGWENQSGADFSEYVWQALFACQVGIRPHQEWVKLKWGFNASALFDEALERQRVFLESQHGFQNRILDRTPRSPYAGNSLCESPRGELIVAVLSKIHARTKECIESAIALYRVKSTFPYDYTLVPARSRDEFLRISGWEFLTRVQVRLI
jgi:hypothetical protein